MKNNEKLNLNQLTDTHDDEKTGAHARKGFAYQDWWATQKALELLINPNSKDFAIGVEIKEDVLVIDSMESPEQLEFYQIKKKETQNWTIPALIKAEKKINTPEKSTLSKLYSRYLDFKADSTNLYFVSNTQLQLEKTIDKVKHKYYIHNSVFSSNIDIENLTKIEKKIKYELNLPLTETINFNQLNYQRSNISALSPDISVIGAITTYNDDSLFPFTLKNISSTCRLLTSEFQNLGMNTDFATDISQLKKRCLTKNQLLQFLHHLNNTFHSPEDYFNEAITQLQSENYHFIKLKKIKDEIKSILVDITDRTALHTQELFQQANTIYKINNDRYYDLNTLSEIMVAFSEDLAKTVNMQIFNINYLNSVALIFIMSEGKIYNERYFNIQTPQIDPE